MESPTSERKLAARELEIKCLELRKRGYTHQAIADELGISENGSYKATKRGLARLIEDIKESAREIVELELQRLDLLLAKLKTKIEEGDVSAINSALRISESRRKLLGLDAPIQTTAPEQSMSDEEAKKLLEQRGIVEG